MRPWDRTYPITYDGRVFAVDTPGHVPGHLAVVVRTGTVTYLLVGDATYDQVLLDAELTDGVNKAPRQAIETMRRIKEFARTEPVVLLPAHDPCAAQRLATNTIYSPSPLTSAP
ncbi:MBL fold metallo-hydrolase [Nocardia sp. NPDC101769]|uniref:MBL fold metallo-hydrolase n=1 Tax=Nocardia sp. NPDC101769 TaxID=3364333 RepID=UPI0037FE4177